MEDFENGYEDPAPPILPGQLKRSHDLLEQDDDDRRVETHVTKDERRAEKRRRKEEKAAKKALKAARKGHNAGLQSQGSVIEMDGESVVGGKRKEKETLDISNQPISTPSEPATPPPPFRKTPTLPNANASTSTQAKSTVQTNRTNAHTNGATANPFQKTPRRPMQPRAGGSSTPRGREKSTEESHEMLQKRFQTPGAMDEWLASKFWDVTRLQELEDAGILKRKKGKFTEEEKSAVRSHLELFKHSNRLSDEGLIDVIMTKEHHKKKLYPQFWFELAAQVPGRHVKSVKDFVQRDFDPRGHKSKWTEEEDTALLKAYAIHPNSWAKIAEHVDRPELDCRDRYRDTLRHRETAKTGHWEPEEEERLIKCVQQANASVGNDPAAYEAPWDIVCNLMGNTRMRSACKHKWQRQLCTSVRHNGVVSNLSREDRIILVTKLQKLGAANEYEVDWQSLCTGSWATLPASRLRRLFHKLKNQIPNENDLTFSELLDRMAARCQRKWERGPRKTSSKDFVDIRITRAELDEETRGVLTESRSGGGGKAPARSVVSDSEEEWG